MQLVEKDKVVIETKFRLRSPDPLTKRLARSNNVLVQVVDDWTSKWHLDLRYGDADVDDLIKDMADLHPHIRLKAISTCARAAEYKAPVQEGLIDLDKGEKVKNIAKLLPERLFTAIECLLEDDSEEIRRAAAIAMFILERPIKKAEQILRETLHKDKSIDRWTAAQCLSFYGECDSQIVNEIIWHLLNTEDSIRHERAQYLLSKLSENSVLVQSMLGEKLNSSSWRHRIIAAKTLPSLYGQINRDLVHKLTQLMWTDWHSEVRKAAAQVLGRTGHGKDVHDELRNRIMTGSERERVEAISKVGHLGIMTAKLLPAFVGCFDDPYVSVRIEACITAASLKIKDEFVLDKLNFLATYDPIWKVKALAIQAFGTIGVANDKIVETLLWALRFESEPGIRAEACRSLQHLKIFNKQVADIIQARYLVEDSPVVRK